MNAKVFIFHALTNADVAILSTAFCHATFDSSTWLDNTHTHTHTQHIHIHTHFCRKEGHKDNVDSVVLGTKKNYTSALLCCITDYMCSETSARFL